MKKVDTWENPLLPKLLPTPPGPNCRTWLWITAHKAQLYYRLFTTLSPDPAFVKIHVLFCDYQTISFWTLHHLSYCMWTVQNEMDTPFASPEFITELLVRESTAKHFLHPVSRWSPILFVAKSSPCTCCIHVYRPYAIPHITNVKRIVDGNPDTSPPFWVAKMTVVNGA